MRRVTWLGVVLAVLVWGAGAWAAPAGTAGVVTLRVLGRAAAVGDEAARRDAAVADARRRAVARVVVSMVDPATLRKRLGELEAKVLARADQFVRSYTLEASYSGEKEALALVEVAVDRAALDRALAGAGLRLPALRRAPVLVLVSEEAAPGRPPVYWWSGSPGAPAAPPPVAEVLKSLGVRLIQPAVLAGRIPPEARQPVLNEKQALELGRLAGAGLVILGRVRTYPLVTPEGEEPPPVAQLMALDVAQGKAVALVEAVGPAFHLTPGPAAGPAVREAVQQAVRELLEQVARNAPEVAAGGGEVSLTLTGVRSLADLMRFEKVLASLTGLVGDLRRDSAGAGWARLRLKLNGSTGQLADRLLVQDFGDFLVNVVEVRPDALKLMLIPK